MAIRFAIEGDLRFISHHDTLRLFERALARAALPVRFSQGFNPRPQFMLPLPRPVGVTSSDESLVVELANEMEPSAARAALAAQMPDGITLLDAEALDESDRRRPCEAEYELPIDDSQREEISRRAAELLAAKDLFIDRNVPGAKGSKRLDVRPYLVRIDVNNGILRWSQVISQSGTIRVGEMLELLGLSSRDQLHRLCRRRVVCQP